MKKQIQLLSKPLLCAFVLLATISCIAIASSTPLIIYNNPESFWLKQTSFYILSFIIIIAILIIKNDRIYSAMWVSYGILMALLIGLCIEHYVYTRYGMSIIPLAKHTNGATSWYRFPGFDIQPSEFMKIILAIVLSKTIHTHNEANEIHTIQSDFSLIAKVLAIALPPAILIYLQNDSGVMLIVLASIIFILFMSGIQAKWFLFGGTLFVLSIGIFVYLFIYHNDFIVNTLGGDHRIGRLYGWIDPEGTYRNEGYQLFNALMSYGTSGLYGHGYQSVVLAYPEPQTDFIFAVICQGGGLISGITTISIIILFNFIIIRIGMKSEDRTSKYFIACIIGMLLFQQIWNISMVLGLLPITGITLPFISYGGSSLLSYAIAIGMIFDIDRQTKIRQSKYRY